MPSGMPISRQWIYILRNGTPVFDWGGGLAQDLMTGDFLSYDKNDISHPIEDSDLEMLKRAGRVERFDEDEVFVFSMPEPPHRTLD
jgi:hypothetical protein